ncbi:MAG: bifunctional metallophosphatase/5'-nucleotidase [Spirochaetaceae bacterium]|nr:MAG: bifunctional metallophosphatase/5'-nucleotidase [Spirochaetaceae bacterium]
MPVQFKIMYTSDTHGRLSAYDFISKSYGNFGLSRFSSYVKGCEDPYLLLDNGDILQGSPLLDYARKNDLPCPVSAVFNTLGYSYLPPGNHDFNFGLEHLLSFQSHFSGTVLCANIHKDGKPLFTPFVIHEICGVKVAVIGLTTEYIPFWERKEHVEGLSFLDGISTVEEILSVHRLRDLADLVVVLYHGGFEKDMKTGASFGNSTVENKGYGLFQIPGVDVLLTGHQHIPQVYTSADGRVALQTGFNALDAGVVDVVMEREGDRFVLQRLEASLIRLEDYPVDQEIEALLEPLVLETNTYLSEAIGTLTTDMRITSPLMARERKHPLFQLINEMQLSLTGADISCASLPNETHGFSREVRRNEVAMSFPFENDLVVMEVSGRQLRQALEQNASYFAVNHGRIAVSPQFLHPKVEHYNYDVYDGISYEIMVRQPVGKRISSVFVGNAPLDDERLYSLALNSYRATGAGGFHVFQQARILQKYPVSYYELVCEYISAHPDLTVDVHENFKLCL